MAFTFRRLTGLLIIAAAFGCPKAVNAPVATVASNQITGVQIGQVVRLDASASKDGQGRDLTYAWQFTAIPIGSTAALNDAHSATPSFLADVDGEYDVQVVVSNAFVSAAALTVKVTVSKCGGRAPVFGANAITAKDAARPTITNNFAVGATVLLSSDVSDPDNATTDSICAASQNQAVSYLWKLIGQPAASAASLNNATASAPSFVADVAGTYTVRLVATDSTSRASVPFDQTFTVSPCGSNAPTISSVTPTTEQLAVGKTIQMSAALDDADNSTACQAVLGALQTFRYHWSLPVLPNGSRASLNSESAQNPSFKPDIEGDYSVRLVIEDSTGRTSAAKDAAIHIARCGNNAPVATITGPTGGAAPSAGFIGILVQFGETVQDLDQQAIGGTPAACTPAIPQSFSLKWSIVALPAGSSAQLNNPTGTNPSFTPDVNGTYTLQLVATDQSGLSSAPASQSVLVKPCGMTPPAVTGLAAVGATTVNAGATVSLTATPSDPDNATGAGACNLPAAQTFTYAWSLVSKPSGSASFIVNPTQDPTLAPAAFTPDVPNGTYQAQLVITDSTGLKSPPAFISVFTNSCGGNAPVVDSVGSSPPSPDPGATVTLSTTGHDPDNTGGGKCTPALTPQQTVSFQWTLVSRPAGSGAAIAISTTPADGSVATFKPDVIGPYQFSVIATDVTGLNSAASFVTVQTSDCGSHAPKITSTTASPAAPRPTLDAVTLSGVVTDADDVCFGGTQPKTSAWTVVSRPSGSSSVISSATSLTAASFTPDVPGSYQFQLDVEDSLGLKAAPAFASVTATSCSTVAPLVAAFTPVNKTQFAPFTFPTPSVTNGNCLPTAAPANDAFAWSIVSAPPGSSATLSNPAVATPSFTPDKVGAYQFALTVTNGAGISAAPVFFNVNAGTCGNAQLGWSSIAVTRITDPDSGNVTLPADPAIGAQVTVSAIASDSNGGCGTHIQPISYQWAIVAAPQGSKATLTSATDPTPAFVPDVPNGDYQLSVVAVDALGNTSAAPDFITVHSTNCGGNLPSVSITPPDLTGTNSIFSMAPQNLSATVTNADNNCTNRFHVAPSAHTLAWTINSQPSTGHATLSSATGTPTSFEAFVPGLYSVHVVATTPNGLSSDPNQATSFVAINAKSCGSNSPVVNSISTFAHLTTNVLSRPAVGQQVDLVANTTDADIACGATLAAIKTWTWSAVALPSGSVAPSTFSAAVNTFPLTPDVAGTFTYIVVATDDTGLQSAAVQVSIATAACGPVVSAVRVNDGSIFLTPDTTNTVGSQRGVTLTFDVAPSIAHAGTGTGAVNVSGNPSGAAQAVVKIITGGATGTATFQLSSNGGATFGTTTTTAASVAGAAGTTLSFVGTFVATDTYSYSTGTSGYLPSDVCVRAPSFAYAWSLSRPSSSQSTLSTLSGVSPNFYPDVPGIYSVQLVVTDNAGLVSAPATVTINAANCGGIPISAGAISADASTGLVPHAGQPNAGDSVALSATPSDTNTCGLVQVQPFTYNWSLISAPPGSSAQLSSTTALSPTFIADVPNGTWQVALTITDQLGIVSSPSFLPVISTACGGNVPSLALTPNPGSVNANTPLTITATAADADNACPSPFSNNTVTQVAWSIVSAPAGSHASLTSSATGNPIVAGSGGTTTYAFTNVFRGDVGPGDYVVQGVATASNGLHSAPAQTTVNVAACGGNLPIVTALDTGGVAHPSVSTTVTITATTTDPDNSVCGLAAAQYLWSVTSAPAGYSQPGPTPPAIPSGLTTNSIQLKPNVAGTYTVQVVAVGATGIHSAPMSITIPTGTCFPVVAATQGPGLDQPIGVPASAAAGGTVGLTMGAASSPCVSGGAAPTVQWSLTSKPFGSAAALSGSTTATPSFTADVPGTYGIQLVVTDNGGFSNVFTATYVASACTPPSISAGTPTASMFNASGFNSAADSTTSLLSTTTIFGASGGGIPGDRVTVHEPASGPGTITPGSCGGVASYEWSMISRPPGSQAVLSSSSDVTPSFVADVPKGTYQLSFLVRDAQGNPSAPFPFSLNSDPCGTNAPSFATASVTFQSSPAPRANAPFTVTAPGVIDGNATCPFRFRNSAWTYAFSVTAQPAGSAASISGSTATGNMTVNQGGGTYSVRVIATSQKDGTSTATAATGSLTGGTAVSSCSTFPPVPTNFSLSQSVPLAAGGTGTVSDTNVAASGSTLLKGGIAAGGTGYFLGQPVQFSTTLSDADYQGATCSTYTALPPTNPASLPATDSVRYAWSLTTVPAGSHAALSGSTTGTVSLTPDVSGGPYVVTLTATDSAGFNATSTVSFSVGCGATVPTAAFTASQTVSGAGGLPTATGYVALGAPIGLDGSTSSDGDATTFCSTFKEAQALSYQWSFTSVPPGNTATIINPASKTPSFTPATQGDYTVQLVVTDPQGNPSTAATQTFHAQCNVNPPAVTGIAFTATQDLTVNGGQLLTIIRSTATSPNARVTLNSVLHTTPANQTFYPGVAVKLSANVVDPDAAANAAGDCPAFTGSISYLWSILSQPVGSTATLSSTTAASPSFTPDLPGPYTFRVVSTDQTGRSTNNDLTDLNLVLAGNCGTALPVAVAAVTGPIPPPFIGTPEEPVGLIQLDAQGSSAPDSATLTYNTANPQQPSACGLSQTLSYNWTLTSAPAGSSASISLPALRNASFTADTAGSYTADVAVSDGTHTRHAQVTVNAVGGFTTSPASTGKVFTATAVDGSGNPILAYWDNSNGTVDALHCTANCNTATPSWSTYLATPIVTGLNPMTFAPEDVPHPIAAVMIGTQVFIAFYTSSGNAPLGTPNVTPAGASLAIFDTNGGTAWTIKNLDNGPAPSDSAGTNAFGRWLTMTRTPTSHPIVSISRQQAVAPFRSINVVECTNPTLNCTATTPRVFTPASNNEGRWHAMEVDGDGTVALAAYVDDDGSGNHGVQELQAAGQLLGTITTTNIGFGSADTGRFVTMATTGTAMAQAGNEFTAPGGVFFEGSFSLGWQFHVSAAVRVTSLGAFVNGAPLNTSHLINIYSEPDHAVVASATVPAGTAAPLIGHFRYVTINPVILAAGQDYTISEEYSATAFDPATTNTIGTTLAPGISWVAARFQSGGGYPASIAGGFTNGYLGPNFQATPAAQTQLIRAIAWRDTATASARFAQCALDTTNTCSLASPQLIADNASGDYGRGITLIPTTSGSLRLAYLDASNGKIRVFGGTPAGAFSKTAEFSSGTLPSGISMAFGLNTFLGYSKSNTGPLGFFSGP